MTQDLPRLPLPSELGEDALEKVVDMLYRAEYYPPTSRHYDLKKLLINCIAVLDACRNFHMLDMEHLSKLNTIVEHLIPLLEECIEVESSNEKKDLSL